MKKFSKYYLNFILVTSAIYIFSIYILFILLVAPSASFFSDVVRYILIYFEKLLPLFILISIILMLYSIFFIFKKKIGFFKYIFIKGLLSFLILFVFFLRIFLFSGVGEIIKYKLNNGEIIYVTYSNYVDTGEIYHYNKERYGCIWSVPNEKCERVLPPRTSAKTLYSPIGNIRGTKITITLEGIVYQMRVSMFGPDIDRVQYY